MRDDSCYRSAVTSLSVMPASMPHIEERRGQQYHETEEVQEIYIDETDHATTCAESMEVTPAPQPHRPPTEAAIRQLPDCSTINRLRNRREAQPIPELVLISTLNGEVTAVNPSGEIVWRTRTGDPLLETSLKTLILDDGRGGQARYIPSLDGSLYRFDGKHVEVVADAGSLLYSSLKTDRWVFSGKRETKQLGIDARTGVVRYLCDAESCTNVTKDDAQSNDDQKDSANASGVSKDKLSGASNQSAGAVLIVRRNTQTVRAIEPHSGKEEWYFSVGENSLRLLEDDTVGCNAQHKPKRRVTFGREDSDNGPYYETGLRVETSTGRITGTHETSNWTLQLGSPIVGAWQLSVDGLEEVDLFEPDRLIGMEHGPQPIFYVGVYQQQLYLQQNPRYIKTQLLTNQWYNQQHAFGAIAGENRPMIDYNPGAGGADLTINQPEVSVLIDDEEQVINAQTALVPFSPWEIFERIDSDTGYYFMQEERDGDCKKPVLLPSVVEAHTDRNDDVREQRHSDNDEWPDENQDDAPIVYVVNSIGNYWKEIGIISVMLSVAVNLLLTQILPYVFSRNGQPISKASPQLTHSLFDSAEINAERSTVTPSTATGSTSKTVTPSDDGQTLSVESSVDSKGSESSESSSTVTSNYVSRYATDFVPVRCLGKGGFGIVFESRNKIDDCSYAVKRIRLPARKGAREKVLREVKALAKLDHQHIVRYYNAWLETPPPGWQQEMDAFWKATLLDCKTNTLSIGTEITPADTGPTTASRSTELASATEQRYQNGGDADGLRKRIDSFNPLRPFDFNPDAWQGSRLGHEDNVNSTQGGHSYSGSWADGGGSWAGEESHDDENDSSLDRGADEMDRKNFMSTVDDSIVFASDDKTSATRSDVVVTNPRKSKTEDDEHYSHETSDEEKENSPRGNVFRCSKNNTEKKMATRERRDSLPVSAGKFVEALGEKSREQIYLYIQIELCKKESLKDWLAQKKTLDERGHDKVLEIFYQISCAVDYIHDSGLIHRDLKPSNIFFSTTGDVVKVGDFGLVTETEGRLTITSIPAGTPGAQGDQQRNSLETGRMPLDVQLTDKVGTQLYMSHEQVMGSKYNQKIDIFALGLILFELLWSLPTQMERVCTLSKVKQLRFPKGFKKQFRDEYQLVRAMLAADPNTRPSAREVLRHSVFNEIRQSIAKRLR
ncbi:eukaryotic translation initiation factor 2-alpha kinase 3-like isoform X2 [Varroa destructor]|uniref:non-specific serine/threonine protein kinase n=1 Tax=Varroa destructor TaxID=109461 RepID=A0A7M7KHL7_VARDE|nr:eukaryotic translation initiation factor 2-alpha kinase 3-like isoform X2 [Varroa destructor]